MSTYLIITTAVFLIGGLVKAAPTPPPRNDLQRGISAGLYLALFAWGAALLWQL